MKFEKLESLRGFAAMYVLIHHLKIGQGTKLALLTMQGQVAVMLFFVLSGFVIMYSSRKKVNYSFKEYFIKRFRRIYPVLIAAMAFAYIMASINAKEFLPLKPLEMLGNLLNLQDMGRHPGQWFDAYYGNTPLWSLTYEWWFYMLFFPIFRFVNYAKQKWVALALSVTGFITYYIHPNQISIILEYFILWWWGVELARIWVETKDFKLSSMKFITGSFVLMFSMLLFQQFMSTEEFRIGFHPFIELRHFAYCFILIGLGLLWRKMKYVGYKYTFRLFLWFAPISYGIYVFHYPIMMKYNLGFPGGKIVQLIVMFFIVLLLSHLIEVVLQKRVNRWSNKFIK